ncbi:MAG: thermonuclease family protein [Deltaproteobacteria bacterium]|nr:thermonuclease family protein [Deltaproteobacteria bacterium]
MKKKLYRIGKEADRTGSKRDPSPLHVYKAVVESVVDGDTLLVRIDLGFNVWVAQRIRFRGINCAEMSDGGEAAKTYVAEQLKDIPFIVIKTYKTDMYGRYVADVFYSPTLKDKEAVAEDGIFLNQEILKAGLAKMML